MWIFVNLFTQELWPVHLRNLILLQKTLSDITLAYLGSTDNADRGINYNVIRNIMWLVVLSKFLNFECHITADQFLFLK